MLLFDISSFQLSGCTCSQYRCPSSFQCVSYTTWCNGAVDCPAGTDEPPSCNTCESHKLCFRNLENWGAIDITYPEFQTSILNLKDCRISIYPTFFIGTLIGTWFGTWAGLRVGTWAGLCGLAPGWLCGLAPGLACAGWHLGWLVRVGTWACLCGLERRMAHGLNVGWPYITNNILYTLNCKREYSYGICLWFTVLQSVHPRRSIIVRQHRSASSKSRDAIVSKTVRTIPMKATAVGYVHIYIYYSSFSRENLFNVFVTVNQ